MNQIGHNNPPEPTPFDRIGEEITDLYDEAKNWLNGDGVQTEADAEGIAKLLDMLRKAEKQADNARKDEKKPHDDAAKAVQTKWKPLIDKAALAVSTCKKALTPYLAKKDAEQRAAAETARLEAEAAEIAAQKAFEQSGVSDLDEREEAERLAEAAKVANAAANRAAKEKAHAKGGGRAIGLRTYYRAEITDATAFAKYAWANHREDLDEFFRALAQRLVNQKQRDIPGVNVREEKEAA